MTLDRETAKALFANAEPMPETPRATTRPVIDERASPAAAPFAPEAPFATTSAYGQTRSPKRSGVDWRLVAPLGVAAVCAGAIALVALPRDPAEEGRTVAASDITSPPTTPLPVDPEPVAATPQAAEDLAPSVPSVTQAATPRQAARSEPAPRRVAERPAPAPRAASADDASANVSAVAPMASQAPTAPTLGAPATVTLTPATPAPAPQPVVTPMPEPQPTPEPQP